ncbi:MAG: ATP-dependent DNA helicase RecQ, partial [Bacteroidales bacterium]|nr:ATP-dependent DNA helicase RecQ [Bacteroidales bacterium]
DPSLEDMAIHYPVKIDDLQNIVGVGAGKAKKDGKGFVDVIREYVEEKDIIRPQDMVVKSVVNKSGVKVYIIQNIDRKLSLDDIANAKSLSLMDLIEEVEAIVGSGTKLNIDYYLNEIMDDEKLDEIFEYFREAETESIDDALAELGEEYFSEEEIRLVRIKFFSELAN